MMVVMIAIGDSDVIMVVVIMMVIFGNGDEDDGDEDDLRYDGATWLYNSCII